MPAVAYVLIYCTSCGEQRKIQPEKAYQARKVGELEWSQFRDDLECPLCKGRMKRMPEYGEPSWSARGLWLARGFWLVSSDVEWMA